MTKVQAGTVSHGTLRTEDLIESFTAELARHTCYTDAPLLREAQRYLDGCPVSDEEACEILDALFDALNDIAPEGMHFGALEGDGSDFGFWYTHEFECERPGGCGAARNPIYTYRTAKMRNGVAAIVTVIRDGEPQYNASYAVLPTRSKAYKYARHMANIGARNMDGHVCHYDSWSTDMWADLERPGGCGAARNPLRGVVNRMIAQGAPVLVEEPSAECLASRLQRNEAAHELALYAINSAELYRQRIVPIITNLRRKKARGVYDAARAPRAWRYAADDAAKRYVREFGGRFDVADRDAAAHQIAAHYAAELEI
jgi:hypothetical protein